MSPLIIIICGDSRTRTYNLLIYSQTNLLIAVRFLLAGEVGIEPTTHGLGQAKGIEPLFTMRPKPLDDTWHCPSQWTTLYTVRCANQLRYSPIKTGNNNCNGLEPFKIKFSRLNLLNLIKLAACFL